MSFNSIFDRFRLKNFHHLRIICYIAIWLTLLALCNIRVSANVAIIGFADTVGAKSSIPKAECKDNGNDAIKIGGEKQKWDATNQEISMLAYNIGYMIGHVPGTFLTFALGMHNVMIITIFSTSILNLASIWAVTSYELYTFLRILSGFICGSMYPIINEAVAVYSPKKERHIVHMFVHTANFVSSAIVFPLGGLFIQSFDSGWKYIFIMTSSFGFFAGILWTIFVWSEPDENIFMSVKEQDFIRDSLYPNGKPPKKSLSNFPFKKMFTDVHLYINSSCHFGKLMVLYMNLIGVVSYFRKVFLLSPLWAGIYGVIPFIGECVLQLSYTHIMDVVIQKRITGTNLRKLHTLIGCIGTFAFLMGSGWVGCNNLTAGVALQTVSLMFVAPFQCGYFLAIIERYGRFSGITFSFINIAGSFSAIVQRGIIILFKWYYNEVEAAQWSFIVTAIISIVFVIPYVLFGTSEPAEWVTSTGKLEEKKKVENLKIKDEESDSEQKL